LMLNLMNINFLYYYILIEPFIFIVDKFYK